MKYGCEAEPYNTVSNVEAKLLYETVYLNTASSGYIICNREIVPEEILTMSLDTTFIGINVIVSGDLHEGGIEGRWVTPSGITLTKIKLLEK